MGEFLDGQGCKQKLQTAKGHRKAALFRRLRSELAVDLRHLPVRT
jgi:hypothetical protein